VQFSLKCFNPLYVGAEISIMLDMFMKYSNLLLLSSLSKCPLFRFSLKVEKILNTKLQTIFNQFMRIGKWNVPITLEKVI